MQQPHHFPPELLQMLIDGLPRLYKSKPGLLDFFKGAGVPSRLFADVAHRVQLDRDSMNKFEIARTILVRLNDDGDASLAARREIVKRVVQHEDFSTAWPADVHVAKAFVADVRRLVQAKDAVTRIEDARREERRERLGALEKAQAERSARRARYEAIRDRLFALFGESDPWRRGKLLETVLNELCALHGILVREAFVLRGNEREGIVEQIDGVIVLDGDVYLVEMKWHTDPLGPDTVAQHWTRVATREGARGVFISASGFTPAAVTQTRDGLALKVFVLLPLQDLVHVLQQDRCLEHFLRARAHAATIEKNPLAALDWQSLPRFA